MEFNTFEAFEIRAEAFHAMTGHMAPGKDASIHSYPAPYAERYAAWEAWLDTHGECVRAVMRSVECVIQRDGDDAD